jgi:C-terminal processing protease CtpA/Prc
MGLAALSGASVVGEDWSPQKGWQKPGESTKRPQYTVEVQLGYEVERGVGVVLQVPAGSSLAARGSVQPGDMIVGIDGQDIKRWSREMMLRALCGAKRSTVRLSLLREL